MKKCKHADKYKGIKKPTCNHDNPCDDCKLKYLMKHMTTLSDNIKSKNKLVCFLYLLMRDKLPTGIVEQLVINTEKRNRADNFEFSNGWLAKYSKFLAKRLEGKK